jgi:hypothetical protein
MMNDRLNSQGVVYNSYLPSDFACIVAGHDMIEADAVSAILHPASRLHESLPAGSRIVALQGSLNLALRLHAAAWLGSLAPTIHVKLLEGEEYVGRDDADYEITTCNGVSATLQIQPYISLVTRLWRSISKKSSEHIAESKALIPKS